MRGENEEKKEGKRNRVKPRGQKLALIIHHRPEESNMKLELTQMSCAMKRR